MSESEDQQASDAPGGTRSGDVMGRLRSTLDGPWLQIASGLLALIVVAFGLYWPILTDFFALDDFIWLQAASDADASDFFQDAFSFPAGSPFDQPTPFWRPAVDAYFLGMWRVFGLDPTPYHVVNIGIHVLNGVLIAVLAWQLTSHRITGFLAGILFLVLPTYDFAVTWISSITELLGAMMYLMTLMLYKAYLSNTRWSGWLYVGAFVAFLLALLSKESAVTIPVALVGVTVVSNRSLTGPLITQRIRVLVPFFALMLAYFAFLYVQEYRSSSEEGLYAFGWHAWRNLWDYLKWLTFPVSTDSVSWANELRPFTASLLLILGCIAIALRKALLAITFAWLLVALLPYLFFQAGVEYRYTYLASIPLAILVTGLTKSALDVALRFSTLSATSALIAVILSLSLVAAVQSRDRQTWISEQALAYERLLHQAPAICGELPRDSHMYVRNSPVFDSYGISSRMALNLHYESINVDLVDEFPDLIAFVDDKCALEYDAVSGTYRKVTEF